MSTLTLTTTWSSLQVLTASALNTNFTDITTYINNLNSGSAAWENMLVTATATNPVQISSNQSSTEVSINNTATDGDPLLTFKLSGTQTHVLGVDDSDSDALVGATTSITTNQWLRIPTTGAQIQINAGSEAAPGLAFIGDENCGIRRIGADRIGFVSAGATYLEVSQTNGIYCTNVVKPSADNTYTCGADGLRWSAVWAANGTIQTSHSKTKVVLGELPDSVEIPKGIFFRRPGEEQIRVGFLADNLPKEAFYPDGVSVETSAPIGVLCKVVEVLKRRVEVLEQRK